VAFDGNELMVKEPSALDITRVRPARRVADVVVFIDSLGAVFPCHNRTKDFPLDTVTVNPLGVF
jgi:hypothetical protein